MRRPDEGWKTVRQKQRPEKREREIVTTYFTTNAPKEATKSEMMKLFAKFGRVTNIYMGTKVGRNGQHYAFIRFAGVEDAAELERRMNGVTIRGKALAVNIVKHDRKLPPPAPTQNTIWKTRTIQNQNH